MKFFCISDNKDTKIGMRLAGIEGIVLKTKKETEEFLDKIIEEKDIAIVKKKEKLVKLCLKKVYEIKSTKRFPLLVTIPGKEGSSNISETIKKYINESIGIKI